MLDINHITKIYRKGNNNFTALDDVTVKIEKGEYAAIVGPSGSGKSTLLHTVGCLNQPDSGQVLYKGRDIYSMNNHEACLFRRENIGFVFQQFHLVPYLTVYENIRLVITQQSNNQYIDRYLEKCSVTPLRNKYPSELSVGEKQRIAFIRAIITRPDFLLADEPTGNLDPLNSSIIMSLIEEFHKEGGTVLLVSHDPETAKYADRHISLQAGRVF